VDPAKVNYILTYFRQRGSEKVDPSIWVQYMAIRKEINRNSGVDTIPVVPPIAPDQNLQQGSGVGKIQKGWVRLGKYEFDRAKLKHHATLSLRYGKTKRKVNGMPNSQITNNLKDHLLHLTTGEGMPKQLEPHEQNMLHHLIKKSEADIRLQPLLVKSTKPAMDPMTELYTMLAEVDAGNDSNNLKVAIEKLLTRLQKASHISFQLAQNIRSHYL